MPLTALLSALPMIGDFMNSQSQQRANNEQRYLNRADYELRKKDALEFWHLQNAYNSPAAQMQRFKDAGLNPALIYGQQNQAAPIQTPDIATTQVRSPEWGNALQGAGLNILHSMADLDIKQAQTNNLLAQSDVIRQEALLKRAQTMYSLTGEERNRFNLDLDRDLRDTNLEFRKELLRQTKVNTDINLDRNAREAALNASNVKEAVYRMAKISAETVNTKEERKRIQESVKLMQQDGTIKELEIQLRKLDINPNDPTWSRIVAKYLQQRFGGDSSNSVFDNMWNYFFKR